MPRIYDNLSEDTQLLSALKTFGPAPTHSIDIATGYFALRGWAAIDTLIVEHARNREINDSIGRPVLRLLIGMVLPNQHRELIESLDAQINGVGTPLGLKERQQKVRAQLILHLREQLARGFPTPEDRRSLASLRELVAAGHVEVKVYTRQPMHGKTYVFHRDDPTAPRVGILGSSNFTKAGLTGNLELNTDVMDQSAANQLSKWFQDLWDDRSSLNIDADLLGLIDESWASPKPRSPYDVFLKVCYTMSRDVRDGLDEYEIDPTIGNILLEYQTTAVKTLARRIMHRRGTMLGDVVGLGKTLSAVAVAMMLRDEHGFQPLIICPKNLVEMWEWHLTEYNLNGRVVPYSMAHKILPKLPRHRFVIVDESHTLRNEGTQAYHAIHQYLHVNDSHVLLLTATPYNLRYSDVANQLALYLDEDEDLGLSPSIALEQNPRLADKLEFGESTLAAFRKSEEPGDWKRLMGEHLIRRTRSFVIKNYTEIDDNGVRYMQYKNADGSPSDRFTFPKRTAIPVSLGFDDDDPASMMTDDETLDMIQNLKLARYDLAKYINADARRRASADEEKILTDFENSRGQVAGFVRTNFYKRLSSCGHSFRQSLLRHLRRNELFLYAIENGKDLPAGTLDPATLSEDESDLEMLQRAETPGDSFFGIAGDYTIIEAEQPKGINWVRPGLFTPELHQNLIEDTEAIRKQLHRYGQWVIEDDTKLRELACLLMEEHPDDKVLIFSEYKDTAIYLADALQKLDFDKVAAATGETSNPTELARRFSPRTNKGGEPVDPEDELRILVATDVLSEGQNLQDSHVIINFDLPWAIIKLIQRAGRVDRVGQESDEVLIYSLMHDSIEEVLGLRSRIHTRLSQNAETFGSDEQFFGTDAEVSTISELFNGELSDVDVGDDVDAGSLAFEIWHKATKDDEELRNRIIALPDLIDATRPTNSAITDRDKPGVVCFTSTESGLEAYGFISESGRTKLLTGHEALEKFESSPQTPGVEMLENHDSLVEKLVTDSLVPTVNTAGRLRGERKIIWNRLGAQPRLWEKPEQRQALDSLYERPLTSTATNVLRRARRNQATDVELLTLLTHMHAENKLTSSTDKAAEPVHIVASMGVK
ncbi:helicase-related protein [Corynebacterium sputi]|uniref:helicase-related protein n=1 Tax=Corynebacterium sputi TaxID=489915 RepID=UPI00047BA870|nr:helicase-related protein [Corynebacterium sputi]